MFFFFFKQSVTKLQSFGTKKGWGVGEVGTPSVVWEDGCQQTLPLMLEGIQQQKMRWH